MKVKNLLLSSILISILISCQSKNRNNPEQWSNNQVSSWLNHEKWLGQTELRIDSSIDQREFAKQYNLNKKRWDEAFNYLKNTDVSRLIPGNYPIDGDNVYVKVTEVVTKDIDSTKWESHHNYADLHYVYSGKEMIGITSVSNVKANTDYNKNRDILFYEGDGPYFLAEPGRVFIIFSNQAHRPFVRASGYDMVKRIVIKVRNADSAQKD